jgi:hypothetical protein
LVESSTPRSAAGAPRGDLASHPAGRARFETRVEPQSGQARKRAACDPPAQPLYSPSHCRTLSAVIGGVAPVSLTERLSEVVEPRLDCALTGGSYQFEVCFGAVGAWLSRERSMARLVSLVPLQGHLFVKARGAGRRRPAPVPDQPADPVRSRQTASRCDDGDEHPRHARDLERAGHRVVLRSHQ